MSEPAPAPASRRPGACSTAGSEVLTVAVMVPPENGRNGTFLPAGRDGVLLRVDQEDDHEQGRGEQAATHDECDPVPLEEAVELERPRAGGTGTVQGQVAGQR